MSLRNILRGVVALVRKRKPDVVVDCSWVGDAAIKREMPPALDRTGSTVFVGDASTGNVFEFRPSQPRPPTPKEMTERKP